MTRVLAIGLDAVEGSFVDRLIDEGELPNLQRIRERAAVARLETPRPYRSEFPWTEFVTGRSADALRYWSTLTFDPDTYRCPVVGAAPAVPFYALGGRRRVIALDVPHSRLAADVDGAQVIGWGAHDPQFPRCSRPAGLLAELEREHGPHAAALIEYAGSWHQPWFLDEFADALLDGIARRVGVVRSLMARVPNWELCIVGIAEAHTAGHQMWHGVDPRSPLHDVPTARRAEAHLRAIHAAIDRSIGDIVAAAPPETTVVVFSVKGMEAADVDVMAPALVPELLHRATFGRSLLRTPRHANGAPVLPDPSMGGGPATRLSFADCPRDRVVRHVRWHHPALLRTLRRLTGRHRAVPARERVTAQPPESIVDHLGIDQIQPVVGSVESWHGACWYQRHWPEMPAFVIPSFSDVHVRINLEGRERHGRVPAADYDAACAGVEDLLRACVDPRTGRPVVGTVTRIRRADPMAPDGPGADLVVECTTPTDALAHPELGTIGPFPYPRVGAHTAHGFAWFHGCGIEPVALGRQPAIDLPPTLLALLGLPPDVTGCEGRSMLAAAETTPRHGAAASRHTASHAEPPRA